MPGARPIRHINFVGGNYRFECEIACRPRSLWRLIWGIGPLVMFRNGALATFDLRFKLLGFLDEPPAGTNPGVNGLDLGIWIGRELKETKRIYFRVPQEGQDTFVECDPLFLNGLGHAEITVDEESAYSFDVWEPAYSIVNWGMLLLAVAAGGVLGFILSLLFGDSGGQSGTGSNEQ